MREFNKYSVVMLLLPSTILLHPHASGHRQERDHLPALPLDLVLQPLNECAGRDGLNARFVELRGARGGVHEHDGSAAGLGGVGSVGKEQDVTVLALAADTWRGRRRGGLPHHEEHRVVDGVALQTLAQTLVGLHGHALRIHRPFARVWILPVIERRETHVGDRVFVLLRLCDHRRPHRLDLRLVHLELRERPVRVVHDVCDSDVLGLHGLAAVLDALALRGLVL